MVEVEEGIEGGIGVVDSKDAGFDWGGNVKSLITKLFIQRDEPYARAYC